MAKDQEKTIQRTYRLPAGDVEMLDLLAKSGLLGSSPTAVLRALVSDGLRRLAESEYVKKQKEALKLLKGE